MKRTLIKSLEGTNGHIYGVSKGRRVQIASCDMNIEVWEDAGKIPILNASGKSKKYRIALILPYNINGELSPDELAHKRIEIEADIVRLDGGYERMFFEEFTTVELDTAGEWVFETDDIEIIKKLLAI